MNLKTPSRKKRRTCYDRLRARMIAARRARRVDPAASAAAQLLAIFTAMVGQMPLTPPAPVRYAAPSVSPAWAERKQLAQRLGVPVRYVEITMARGEVPYSVLFHHIRGGGVLRRDAMRVLRTRAPEASIDWLDHVEVTGRWSDLLLCFVRSEYDEDTDIKLLQSTIAWLDTLSPAQTLPGRRKPEQASAAALLLAPPARTPTRRTMRAGRRVAGREAAATSTKSIPGDRRVNKPNWKLIEPFIKAVHDLDSAISDADRIGDRAWDFECKAAEEGLGPSGNTAFQHLHDALAELHRAQKAVAAARDHLGRIGAKS